jgi:DNA-binding beta-propeller fold protein YncE
VSHPRIAVFARLANGNAAPVRAIEGQAAKLSRSVHGIAYDKVHDEIVITNPLAEAVLFFRGGADGEEAPVRIIQGPKTLLSRQFGGLDNLAVDGVNGEVFVPLKDQGGAILVFRREAGGDVAPSRVLMGPKTRLNRVNRVAVDPVNNLLVVGTGDRREDPVLLLFNRTDEGDTAPRAVIAGSRTGLDAPLEIHGLALHPEGKKIFAAMVEPEPGPTPKPGFVGVWGYGDAGNAPPLAVLKGPNSMIIRPRGVAVSPRHGEIYVVNMRQNALLTYALRDVFD